MIGVVESQGAGAVDEGLEPRAELVLVAAAAVGLVLGENAEGQESVVELMDVPNEGPGVAGRGVDGLAVEGAEVSRVLRQGAAQGHGTGAALLQGCVVQEGVGHGIEDLMGEDRRLGRGRARRRRSTRFRCLRAAPAGRPRPWPL